MYLRLLDIDKFVEINGLQEVSDPIYLEHGKPTPKGLFSYEIFGISQYDRSSIWAYIDLGARFLHPLAAINFKRYGSVYENIIYGLKNYKMVDGEFIEDPDGDTGIDFLYKNYDKIKWRATDSVSSKERIDFLKQGKNKIFITKFPVNPPFYRDINENKNMGIPEVNEIYKRIISQCSQLKRRGSFSFFGNLTRANVQRALVDLFNHYVMDEFSGKTGMMRRSVMGRNIDDGVWLVMSSPVIKGNSYKDMPVNFDRCGIPLAALLSMNRLLIFKSVRDFFDNEFLRSGKYPVIKDNKMTYVDLIHPEVEFSDDFLNKKISQFIKGYSTRFEPIPAPKNSEGIDGYLTLTGRYNTTKQVFTRPLTWTDVFYLATMRSCENKYVMISRYPIEEFFGIIYVKPFVMSTTKTIDVTIDGVNYPYYPVVEVGEDSSNSFLNTLAPSNVYLKSMGGDYDGDLIYRATYDRNIILENLVND